MQVPLLDLKPQYNTLRDRILPRVTELLESQELILGPAVAQFEEAVCTFSGAQHAIGMSSGSDALLAVLMALEIGPGDAVVTTPYTFFATAGAIHRVGAEMVFVDIDPLSYNLCPHKLEEVLLRCTEAPSGGLLTPEGKRIKAVMPVHLFGQCCELDAIAELAGRYGIPLIEDAAQALGAVYPAQDGSQVRAGTYGAFGCFSFYPTKNLGGVGDGGMVVCRDADMADRLRIIRNHGMENRYYHNMVGGNFRLDAIQAAVLEIKLEYLDRWSQARRDNETLYREHFSRLGLDGTVGLPGEVFAGRTESVNRHIYNQFVVRVPRRTELMEHLKADGVGHAVYYPLPLHLQPCFSELGYREGDFPESERAALETLALPIFPELTPDQIRIAAESIATFYFHSK